MILSFIDSTLNFEAEKDKPDILSDVSAHDVTALGNSLPENIELINNENIQEGSSENKSLQLTQGEDVSFEAKYKTLMKKIEKERFERELLAKNG
jgi:hypothetical protein